MQRSGFKGAMTIAVALACLALSGCADSNVLETSTGLATVTIEIVAAGGSTQYEEASLLGFSQIMVRPVDPVADQALGPEDIGLLLGATDVLDLVGGATVAVPSIVLSPGAYRVTEILLIPDGNIIRLVDNDPPPPPTDDNCDGFPDTVDTRRCLDRVMYPFQSREDEGFFQDGMWVCPPREQDPPEAPILPTPGNVGGQPQGDVQYHVVYDDPATAPRVVIQDQSDTPVVLLVDGQGLIMDFEASFECQATSICQGGSQPIFPPCNRDFHENEGMSPLGEHFDGFVPLMQDKFQF